MSATVESVKEKLSIEQDRRNLPHLSLQEFSLPLAVNDALNKIGIGGNEVAWGEEAFTECLWMGTLDFSNESLIEMDETGSLIGGFGQFVSGGVEVDSDGCVWGHDDGYDSVWQFTQSGSITGGWDTGSAGTTTGMGIGSDACIWIANESYDRIDRYTRGGSRVGGFNTRTSIGGLGVDADDCLWLADDGNNDIIKYNRSGSIISSISSPGGGPLGVTFGDAGCIWHVDDSNTLYQLTTDGSVVYSTGTPYTDPTGLGKEGPPPS